MCVQVLKTMKEWSMTYGRKSFERYYPTPPPQAYDAKKNAFYTRPQTALLATTCIQQNAFKANWAYEGR